jgi:hypothetical protein
MMYVGAWQEFRLASILAEQAKEKAELRKEQVRNLDFSRLRRTMSPVIIQHLNQNSSQAKSDAWNDNRKSVSSNSSKDLHRNNCNNTPLRSSKSEQSAFRKQFDCGDYGIFPMSSEASAIANAMIQNSVNGTQSASSSPASVGHPHRHFIARLGSDARLNAIALLRDSLIDTKTSGGGGGGGLRQHRNPSETNTLQKSKKGLNHYGVIITNEQAAEAHLNRIERLKNMFDKGRNSNQNESANNQLTSETLNQNASESSLQPIERNLSIQSINAGSRSEGVLPANFGLHQQQRQQQQQMHLPGIGIRVGENGVSDGTSTYDVNDSHGYHVSSVKIISKIDAFSHDSQKIFNQMQSSKSIEQPSKPSDSADFQIAKLDKSNIFYLKHHRQHLHHRRRLQQESAKDGNINSDSNNSDPLEDETVTSRVLDPETDVEFKSYQPRPLRALNVRNVDARINAMSTRNVADEHDRVRTLQAHIKFKKATQLHDTSMDMMSAMITEENAGDSSSSLGSARISSSSSADDDENGMRPVDSSQSKRHAHFADDASHGYNDAISVIRPTSRASDTDSRRFDMTHELEIENNRQVDIIRSNDENPSHVSIQNNSNHQSRREARGLSFQQSDGKKPKTPRTPRVPSGQIATNVNGNGFGVTGHFDDDEVDDLLQWSENVEVDNVNIGDVVM